MKYKVGDEVLVKTRIIRSYGDGKYITEINEDGYYKTFDYKENDIFPYPSMTAEEAWEIAGKIYEEIDINDICDIFGTYKTERIMKENAPQQAKAKIEAWEAAKEINIGDEVEFDDTANDLHRSMYVTSKYNDTNYCGICRNGDTYCVHKSALKKTGRHIDIEGLLKQIGGDE